MSNLRLAFLVLGPTAAVVVVAASCSPIVRNDPVVSGGAGGAMVTSLSGVLTTGAVMTTSTEATSGSQASATSGIPATSGGPCADTVTDPANCGVCGHDCSVQANAGVATCVNGVCAFTCSGGYLDCNVGAEDGCETDPVNDPKNCNGCGTVCGLTQTCSASSCTDTFTSCSTPGVACADPTCEEPKRFSVDAEVAVDLMNGKALWQRLSKGPIDWVTASSYCASATFSGISGWRLPTQVELATLLYNAGGQDGCATPNCGPAVDQSVFIDSFSDDYWTTDPGVPPEGHLCVSFCTGFSLTFTATDHYARCTHDPLP
jgi:hypothetical protein